MTESNKTELDNAENRVLSFGEHLYVERKRQNLSVSEVAQAIHLSEKVIDAIERSDVDQLPQPAFVQGYLRVYARYLGISEALVLKEYANAVPHKLEAELYPRSTLPSEASSDSPFVKIVTILVFVIMAVAALYASFSYYKNAIVTDEAEIIVTDEAEIDGQVTLSLPESDITDQPGDEIDVSTFVDEPAVASEQNMAAPVTTLEPEVKVSELPTDIAVEQVPDKAAEDKVAENKVAKQKPLNQFVAKGDDTLELSATEVSWVEVSDANAQNLYFNLLQQGQSVVLKGTAPFKIFLGNAPHVAIKMNDVSVNADKYIRSNNIATFSISVDDQQVVFH